jgi:hypothetical protein
MSETIVLSITLVPASLINTIETDVAVISAAIPALGPRGPRGPAGGGLVKNTFQEGVNATLGQTTFTVDFEANDNYLVMIDDVPQGELVVTRYGNTFTYSAGLSAGQKITIYD